MFNKLSSLSTLIVPLRIVLGLRPLNPKVGIIVERVLVINTFPSVAFVEIALTLVVRIIIFIKS